MAGPIRSVVDMETPPHTKGENSNFRVNGQSVIENQAVNKTSGTLCYEDEQADECLSMNASVCLIF